jgi:glycosyltransferase involved in cell wall biosynthesis
MISIVVPLLNEQDSLVELVERIQNAVQTSQLGDFEVILIDDGSKDDSWKIIERLATDRPYVRGIRFRRNFGKAAALSAGFQSASGEYLITMDADLQDDPNELKPLLEKLHYGFDVVSGWKQTRHDPWHKTWPSLVFNGILRSFTKLNLHDFNCGLKAYRREVLQEVSLYGEMHRFIPVLAAARGFRVTEIPVKHHPRMHGVSKYGVSRILKGFLDLFTVVFLTRFRYRPQHLLGGIGAVACGTGGIILLGLIGMWCLSRVVSGMEPIHLHERAMFYLSMVLFLVGLQMLGVGLLAELVVANSGHRDIPYSISQRTSPPQSLGGHS